MDKIEVRGARTHNLKNISLSIPRNKLVMVTGLSGSGKSSLVFDTLYAEGQRRYIESLSVYARRFFCSMDKPDVDHIQGLSPAIAIEQKFNSHNPRSTVGTITEIYDHLRLLFSRIGEVRCPEHNIVLVAQTVSQMVDQVLTQKAGRRLMLLAPIATARNAEHINILEYLAIQGYIRIRIDGKLYDLSDAPAALKHRKKHILEVVVDRFYVRKNISIRLAESFETTLQLSRGIAIVADMDDVNQKELFFSSTFSCPLCGYSMCALEPRMFSFNNPLGACSVCEGLGVQQYFDPKRVVLNPQLSLADGAVQGWGPQNLYYFQILRSLSEYLNFDIETPYSSLNEKIRTIILYGSGKDNIPFKYINDRGDSCIQYHPFEGVLNNIERRYKKTESHIVREELAKFINSRHCTSCSGTRLRLEARHVFIENINLPTILEMSVANVINFFYNLPLSGQRAIIAESIIKEINYRLRFLVNVGLEYLSMSRRAETLSGGEAQRIRLASQIGSGLVGVMYILDEPSIGLHQRDNNRLLNTLIYLRDLGNTVIVVEHDEDAIRAADHIIDIGPAAGRHGGYVVAEGNIEVIKNQAKSLTGQYLSGKRKIIVPKNRVQPNVSKMLILTGASGNNLKNITLVIPVGLFTCITGVSGSGKSTLINDTLLPVVKSKLSGMTIAQSPKPYRKITGLEHFDKVIDIDQSAIGRTSRSNPATYTGIFMPIRELFANVSESRLRGYKASRFSFNIRGGRCEACRGDGVIKVEMHFLPNIYVSCDECGGKRYNRETLQIQYKGKNIYEVLEMTIEDAFYFFDAIPILSRKLKTMINVGLSYICLGQSATTLSGGEAQRVKLARELSKCSTGKTLYIFDEPTTGLHFADIQKLLEVLCQLRTKGNTIIVIEHHLDVIKTADWIIDLGPEGGQKGGEILVQGTPEIVAKCKKSHTARFLKSILKNF
ncbi:UvrA protein [Candidatus Pantoea carbekii]|uniref:UvrABC system protein A n=1 Tax=Candidatus Pantoea carbekii TaxID=1235990 RepID=U3U707_9GAMM|nr:UvrA protein [Candidatus Pantoea carbekii]